MNTAGATWRRLACAFSCSLAQLTSAQTLPIEKLDHYAINTVDLEKSAAWYFKVLGMTPIKKWDGVWLLGGAAGRVGIFQAPANAARSSPEKSIGFLHVAFSVPAGQLDSLKSRLTQGEIAFREEDIGIANSVFVNDPDGNEIEFIQYK